MANGSFVPSTTGTNGVQGTRRALRSRACRKTPMGAVKRGRNIQQLVVRCYQPAADKQDGQPVTLSPELRKATAVLSIDNAEAPGGKTDVYVMGMSHVSKKSSEQVGELIREVRPDVVLLELCRDRVGLLVDPDAPPRQIWHMRSVRINGLPEREGYPTQQQVVAMLTTRPGAPVTVGDIEADCAKLLATGIFGSVRPQIKPGGLTDAPEFLVDGERLRAVAPFSMCEFVVTPRELPRVQQFSTRLEPSVDNDQLRELLASLPAEIEALALQPVKRTKEEVEQAAKDKEERKKEGDKEEKEGAKEEEEEEALPCTVDVLMAARARVLEACKRCGLPLDSTSVVFKGVDIGRVEALVKDTPAAGPAPLTGLEATAVGGKGKGIETFKPSRQFYTLTSGNLRVDVSPWVKTALGSVGLGAQGAGEGAASQIGEPRTQWRQWPQGLSEADEERALEEARDGKGQVARFFSGLLVDNFAKRQAAAGRNCGIEVGEAWRVALQAAAEVGTQQVVLGDVPTSISGQRLSNGVFRGVALRAAAGAAAVAGIVAAAAADALPAGSDQYAPAAAAVALALAAWPVAWPLIQIGRLADMDGEQVEAALELKEPIQGSTEPLALTGEDALLQWPGAMEPIIHQRDAFMARATAAAARGVGLCPAYVYDVVNGKAVFRYMMAEGGAKLAAPEGRGDGEYVPLRGPKSVVAVVGSAHVRGMIKEWDSLSADDLAVDTILQD